MSRTTTGSTPAAATARGARPSGTTEADNDWTAAALCATRDPDLLFVTGAAQREAARMCDTCPVKLECLSDALDNRVEYGVWGGLTERQRRAILRRNPDVVSWYAVLSTGRDLGGADVAGPAVAAG